jgi:hypothetical protein
MARKKKKNSRMDHFIRPEEMVLLLLYEYSRDDDENITIKNGSSPNLEN